MDRPCSVVIFSDMSNIIFLQAESPPWEFQFSVCSFPSSKSSPALLSYRHRLDTSSSSQLVLFSLCKLVISPRPPLPPLSLRRLRQFSGHRQDFLLLVDDLPPLARNPVHPIESAGQLAFPEVLRRKIIPKRRFQRPGYIAGPLYHRRFFRFERSFCHLTRVLSFYSLLPLILSFLLHFGIKPLPVWDNFHNVCAGSCHLSLRFTLTVASPTDSPMTVDFSATHFQPRMQTDRFRFFPSSRMA